MTGTLHEDCWTFWSFLTHFFLEWETFQKKIVEKIKTHILCSIIFSFRKYSVYKTTWENIVQWGRPQMTIWRMRIACWTPRAIKPHSEYVILIAFPLQKWLYERAAVLRLCTLSVLFKVGPDVNRKGWLY
jgi:hypothetical protein